MPGWSAGETLTIDVTEGVDGGGGVGVVMLVGGVGDKTGGCETTEGVEDAGCGVL